MVWNGSTIKPDSLIALRLDQEEDGRIIAEISALPGCLVYGRSRDEAIRRVKALALRVIADKLEHGELEIDGPVASHLLPSVIPAKAGIHFQ